MHHWKNLSFLSSFGLRAVFVKGSKIAVFVTIVTSKRTRWPPLFIIFLSSSWLVISVHQVSSTIYVRFFYWRITLKILNTVIAHTNLSSPSVAHCVFLAWEQKTLTLSFLKDRLVINWKLIWSIPSWLIFRGRRANFRSQPFESAVYVCQSLGKSPTSVKKIIW